MVNEDHADFQINVIAGTSSKQEAPVDFVIHGVTGIDPELQADFIIHPQVVTQPVRETDDDFAITARETQPIPREMPTLENALVVGKFDANRIPVFMSANTFSAVQQHLSSLSQSQTPYLELAGAPIGRYCVDSRGKRFVEILAYVPFSTASTGGDVQIPTQEHFRALKVLDDLRARGLSVNMVAGWIHSHPKMIPAPSDADITTARGHYNADFMSTIIFDPINKQIGVFEPNDQDGLRNKGGLVVMGKNRQVAQGIRYCQKEHL